MYDAYNCADKKPLLFSTMLLHSISACAEDKNGFDLDHGLIPPQQIFKGGPEKDAIPAIDQLVFINARCRRYTGR